MKTLIVIMSILLPAHLFAQELSEANNNAQYLLNVEGNKLQTEFVEQQLKTKNKIWCEYSIEWGGGSIKEPAGFEITNGADAMTFMKLGFGLGRNFGDFFSISTGIRIWYISGDATGNLAGDGCFTIPLQFRYLFDPYKKVSLFVAISEEYIIPDAEFESGGTMTTLGAGIAINNWKYKKGRKRQPWTISWNYEFFNGSISMCSSEYLNGNPVFYPAKFSGFSIKISK